MRAKNPGAACRELARRESSLSRPPRRWRRRKRARLFYLFTGMLVLYVANTPKRRRATGKRRYGSRSGSPRPMMGEKRARISRFPRASAATRNAATSFWLFRGFFPPTDCPTVDLVGTSRPRALYPSVLRMLPTRLNGSLVRACTRLLRLLATRCSWHSYLNVIPPLSRTARSYPCTCYVANPFPISHFNRLPATVLSHSYSRGRRY